MVQNGTFSFSLPADKSVCQIGISSCMPRTMNRAQLSSVINSVTSEVGKTRTASGLPLGIVFISGTSKVNSFSRTASFSSKSGSASINTATFGARYQECS